MTKKNDPLVESVKKVMVENDVRRAAEALVNESFGIQSKKALPHEHHAEYDAVLAEATEIALDEADLNMKNTKAYLKQTVKTWGKAAKSGLEKAGKKGQDIVGAKVHKIAQRTMPSLQEDKGSKQEREIKRDEAPKATDKKDVNKIKNRITKTTGYVFKEESSLESIQEEIRNNLLSQMMEAYETDENTFNAFVDNLTEEEISILELNDE